MSSLTFYFKSGNKVTIDKVTNWEVSSNGDVINYISIAQTKTGFFKCKKRLIVKSLDMKAIDCIIEHD